MVDSRYACLVFMKYSSSSVFPRVSTTVDFPSKLMGITRRLSGRVVLTYPLMRSTVVESMLAMRVLRRRISYRPSLMDPGSVSSTIRIIVFTVMETLKDTVLGLGRRPLVTKVGSAIEKVMVSSLLML